MSARGNRGDCQSSRLEHVLCVGLQRALVLRGSSVSMQATSPQKKRMKYFDERNELNDSTIRRAVEEVLDALDDGEEEALFHPEYGHINFWKTHNVTDMGSLFKRFGAIDFDDEGIDLKEWDTGNVEDMAYMFQCCEYFTSDLSGWNVEKVKNMSYMFEGCVGFTSDLSKWKVDSVERMNNMFSICSQFKSDLCDWKVHNVTDMSYMFFKCTNFNCNLSNWDVGNVTAMLKMFSHSGFSPDSNLESWDVRSCADFYGMFEGNVKVNEPSFSHWRLHPTADIGDMSLQEIFMEWEGEYDHWEKIQWEDFKKRTLLKFPIGFLDYDIDFPVDDWGKEPLSKKLTPVVRSSENLLVGPSENGCTLTPARDGVVAAFQRLMNATSPEDFVRERRDISDTGPFPGGANHHHLRVVHVYEISNARTLAKYEACRKEMASDMNSDFCKEHYQCVQCARTDKIVEDLKQTAPVNGRGFMGDRDNVTADFDETVSEKLLLHGTGPAEAFSIANNGFMDPSKVERAHGHAYGSGVYFAEDAAKSDGYSTSGRHPHSINGYYPDQLDQHFAKSRNKDLGVSLERTLYYTLGARVLLGCAAHVKGGKMVGSIVEDIVSRRPAHHEHFHSVIVEYGDKENEPRDNWTDDEDKIRQGARFREFVVGDVNKILPMFLIVYERTRSGDPKDSHDYRDLDCPWDYTLGKAPGAA